MYRYWRIALFILLLSVCWMAEASGESLWTVGTSDSLFVDKRAAKVGDIVTILIVESAVSQQQASTDTKKESELEAGPGTGPLLEKIPLFSYSGGDSVNAAGSTTRTSKFIATMSAVVTEVNPNGTLCIEGTRFVQTNKEKEEIKLSGMVRQEDISSDNTILSTSIADASITHVGSGPIGSRQKEGLISKIFKILF